MRKPSPQEKKTIACHLFGRDGSYPAFFGLYDELASRGGDLAVAVGIGPGVEPPLTHSHLLQAVDTLKEDPNTSKGEVLQRCREKFNLGQSTIDAEVETAIDLAVQSMIMVDCAAKRWHAADYMLGGYRPTSWRSEEAFLDFVQRSFPLGSQSAEQRGQIALEGKASLKAWKLEKRLGVKFRGTDNLAEHLLYDPRRNCLLLFHHAEFLKAHIDRQQGCKHALRQSMLDSLKSGTLPSQLLVETLHSMQTVLFPPDDQKSVYILKELISKRQGNFDPECAQYDGYHLLDEPSEDFRYVYWAERISLLHELLISRPPRNKLERWLQWQSSEGNALLVALLALLISIFVGLISIGLAGVQTWIAWQAWKHPVQS